MKLVINVEIWNIVAHIAFKFYPGASGTFSTASTMSLSPLTQACPVRRERNLSSRARGRSKRWLGIRLLPTEALLRVTKMLY